MGGPTSGPAPTHPPTHTNTHTHTLPPSPHTPPPTPTSASVPKTTTSTATLFFFSFLPILTRVASSSATGDPTNRTTRWRWCLLARCLRASWATWTEEDRLEAPSTGTSWRNGREKKREGGGVSRGESSRGVNRPAVPRHPACGEAGVPARRATLATPQPRTVTRPHLRGRRRGASPPLPHPSLSFSLTPASRSTRGRGRASA